MNLEETKVRLTAGAKARIIALVGEQRMAAFIRQAVDAAIEQAEREAKALTSRRAKTPPKTD